MRNTMTRFRGTWGLAIGVAAAIAATLAGATVSDEHRKIESELFTTEAAFARTMADRDHAAFTTFIADEAVFLGRSELRGKEAVVEAWAGFLAGARGSCRPTARCGSSSAPSH